MINEKRYAPCIRALVYAGEGVAGVLLSACPAWALGGCVDSPENPSIVLVAVGAAGAVLALAYVRRKVRDKRFRE